MKKKYVYVIKNLINGKRYIGQTNNLQRRWQEHKHDKRKGHLLYLAIKKYGEENFRMDPLYYGEDYNRVEKNWIILYETRDPDKGYNIAPGGQDSCGEDNPSCTITNEIADNVKNDLIYTDLSIKKIAKKYSINSHPITNINYGLSFSDPLCKYPLRVYKNKETAKKSTSIIKDLKNNDLGIEDICEKYSLKRYQVLNINKGKTYRDDNESYPIREVFLPKETRLKIIDLLKNTDLYYKEIAEITGTNISEVSNINSGKVWFDKNINYPIRNSTCDK